MPIDSLLAWLMVAFRATGLVLLLPSLNGRSLPMASRVVLPLCLATLLYGLVPHAADIPATIPLFVGAMVRELLLGLSFGFVGRMLFSAVELAGRIISGEIGLIAAPGFDAPVPAQEPLPAFVGMFAGLLFFVLGGHHGALAAFARSFDLAPAGLASFAPDVATTIINASGHVIELGVRIAAPFIALNFLVTLAFSVLGRAVPKMNVFVMSYPLRSILGFSLLAGSGGLILRYMAVEFDALPWRLLEMVGRS